MRLSSVVRMLLLISLPAATAQCTKPPSFCNNGATTCDTSISSSHQCNYVSYGCCCSGAYAGSLCDECATGACTTTTTTTTGGSTTGGTGDITAGSAASVTAEADHVCDILNPSLGGTPCTCSETTGGTGAIVECMESIAGVGDVGVRVQIEPCGDPAHAEISYSFGGGWESAGSIEADGEPLYFPVPGASLVGAGLYIEVTITGNAADLSVHAKLSACIGDECDGDVSVFGVGSMLSAAGFPFALVQFDDLSFVQACPSDDMTMYIAAAGALLLLAGVVGAMFLYKKKRKPPTPSGVVMTTTSSSTPTSTVTSSDENKV